MIKYTIEVTWDRGISAWWDGWNVRISIWDNPENMKMSSSWRSGPFQTLELALDHAKALLRTEKQKYKLQLKKWDEEES